MNEQIRELGEALSVSRRTVTFLCECARPDCTSRIEIVVGEYALIRGDPRHFLIVPSLEHYSDTFESVLEMRETYWVVEKEAPGTRGRHSSTRKGKRE